MKLKLPSGKWIRFMETPATRRPFEIHHDNPALEESIRSIWGTREKNIQSFTTGLERQLGSDITKWELVEDWSDQRKLKWYYQRRC